MSQREREADSHVDCRTGTRTGNLGTFTRNRGPHAQAPRTTQRPTSNTAKGAIPNSANRAEYHRSSEKMLPAYISQNTFAQPKQINPSQVKLSHQPTKNNRPRASMGES